MKQITKDDILTGEQIADIVCDERDSKMYSCEFVSVVLLREVLKDLLNHQRGFSCDGLELIKTIEVESLKEAFAGVLEDGK